MKLYNKFKNYVKTKWTVIFKYLCLQICLLNNWFLRKLIIMNGKNPDSIPLSFNVPETKYKSGDNLDATGNSNNFFNDFDNFHVKNSNLNPIILNRKKYISEKIKNVTDAMYSKNDLILNDPLNKSGYVHRLEHDENIYNNGYPDKNKLETMHIQKVDLDSIKQKSLKVKKIHTEMVVAGLCVDSDESKKILLDEMFKLNDLELDHISNMAKEHMERCENLKSNISEKYQEHYKLMAESEELLTESEDLLKLIKAKKICKDMVVLGLCEPSEKDIEDRLQSILKFPDISFNSLLRVIERRMEDNATKKS